MKKEKLDDFIITFFGSIGIFGWFFAIWVPEYRWRIFFTCIVSLGLALIFRTIQKEEEEKK